MIRKSPAGYSHLNLNVCCCDILEHLLHPEGAWVWIHYHDPDPIMRWWKALVPISPGDLMEAEIRGMSYDMQLPLEVFRANLHRFQPHGIKLTQLTRRVPNGLLLEHLPEDHLESILLQNGMISRFYLPHAREVAQFSCTDESHLRSLCEHEKIKPLIL